MFFSHSSSEYEINRVAFSVFPNPSGRLIHYSRKTGQLKVLLDKLWFTNGVALSPAEDFAVVVESYTSRIMRVWLNGEKKGVIDIFFDGLPGAPDNLSYDENGLWVPIATAADENHPMVPHLVAPYPMLRKFVGRLLELTLVPFDFVNSIYPNLVTNAFTREFGSMDMISYIIPSRRSVIRLDWNGKVVESLHGSDKSCGSITHVLKQGDHLYLGSVINNYISKVKA